ncbi:MAG: TOBE-like domain-containing protein [Acidipropionibacterium sp.]|jgi:sulfate transport system ATP-binding protein|nr:TOBE-like domain-containing protein [Acidipropionibacterium sp.]
MSIDIRGVNKSFGDFAALTDINLAIPSGKITALLGPSGGGKTTLLRIVAGLENADSGTVSIEGADTTNVPARKRNIGFVFQHYAVFKHLTVAGNVGFGLSIRHRPKDEIAAKVNELLELVHLEQFADRLPSQLSGGQRQRMALARALAIQPALLLLDEPFGALDAKVRKELREWLRELHDKMHVTTVFVTHDQEEALEVADNVVVINSGTVEQVGPPATLYDEPASPFVMGFLGEVTTLGGQLIRPHDIVIHTDPRPGALAGTIVRAQRVGFEARLHVRPEGAAADGSSDVLVNLTRTFARSLGLHEGEQVWLEPEDGATTLPAAGVSASGRPAPVLGSPRREGEDVAGSLTSKDVAGSLTDCRCDYAPGSVRLHGSGCWLA